MADPYVYPGTSILRNNFDIKDADKLDVLERRLATQKIIMGCPKGNFDLPHLSSIHKHIFGDLYDWAGKIRTVEMWKGESQFQLSSYIKTGMEDIHSRIKRSGYFTNLSPTEFAKLGSQILGDLNYCHPFREGNGRCQLQYFKQLAHRAGYNFQIQKLEKDKWIEASIQANNSNYELMCECIQEVSKAIGKEKRLGLER